MSEEKDKFQIAVDTANELNTMTLTETGVDIELYSSAITSIATRKKNANNIEAEEVVKSESELLIDKDFVVELEKKRDQVENFIRTYDPNKEIVKNLKETDVDKIYTICNYLLNSYVEYVNDMKFNFKLTVQEYKFLNKILNREIEYNADEVFNYTELMSSFWVNVTNAYNLNKDKSEFELVANIKETLILHHLIKNYKVKGITTDFITFKSILYKIAQINKLFNAYSIIIERIKGDQQLWGTALDEVLTAKENELASGTTCTDENVEK